MMHRILGTLVLLLLALGGFASAGSGTRAGDDDETIPNFKKYYRTYKDAANKREAVLTLQGVEDVAIVELLVPLLKEPEPEVVRGCVIVLASYKTRPPVDALLVVLKDTKDDQVRSGILRALEEGKYPDVAAGVVPCLADKSWDVRRHALKALRTANDKTLADKVLVLCDDPEVAVRCEALETLAQFGAQIVIPKALVSLNDKVWQVRASAIVALTKIRHVDAVDALVTRMGVEDGRLTLEIAEALANLTGFEHGPDPAKWKAWWAEKKKGYALPTVEGVAFLRAKREAVSGKPGYVPPTTGATAYHGIQTPSKHIIFVIDCSGSMEAEVVEKDRFSDGNYPSYQRIDIVKTELANTINRLESYVNFNILEFATQVKPWKDKLVQAKITTKSAAMDWIKNRQAIGGSSKEDFASAGLAGSANLDMGKTNTYEALMMALNAPLGPKGASTGAVDKNYKTDVDTIFFLSDGRPTVGAFIDPEDILREVKAANELRKIVIHTIAIGEFQKDFMKKIAEQNGGVFVDLGK